MKLPHSEFKVKVQLEISAEAIQEIKSGIGNPRKKTDIPIKGYEKKL
jgi:hypothetical protein